MKSVSYNWKPWVILFLHRKTVFSMNPFLRDIFRCQKETAMYKLENTQKDRSSYLLKLSNNFPPDPFQNRLESEWKLFFLRVCGSIFYYWTLLGAWTPLFFVRQREQPTVQSPEKRSRSCERHTISCSCVCCFSCSSK